MHIAHGIYSMTLRRVDGRSAIYASSTNTAATD